MKKYWSYVTNGKFCVGCTERMVCLYDHAGAELAKFRDISHGCDAAFSPVNNTFVVKSTGAYFAVYSADTMELLHKVKFSNVDGGQDDGFCFSPDVKYFINIERQKSSVNSAISVYETENYTRVAMMHADDHPIEVEMIEFGSDHVPYVIGFTRGENGVKNGAFVAKLGNGGLDEMRAISEEELYFYRNFKRLEMRGFAEKAKEWSGFRFRDIDMTGMENESHPFKALWESH